MKWRLVLVLGSFALPVLFSGCAGCEGLGESSSVDAGGTPVNPAANPASPTSQSSSVTETKVPPGMADPLGRRIRPRFFLHRDSGSGDH